MQVEKEISIAVMRCRVAAMEGEFSDNTFLIGEVNINLLRPKGVTHSTPIYSHQLYG